jgi:hypothetical protein
MKLENHTASFFRVAIDIANRHARWEQWVGRIEKEEVYCPP